MRNDEYGVESDWATDAEITSSIIWGNGSTASDNLHATNGTFSVNYSCIEGGYTGTDNITSDPCFVDDVNDDYHLTWNSNCVDTGDPNFAWDANETDIDGGPRVINERVDMGADEFYWSPADLSGDGIVNFIDYAMLTSYWQDAGVDYNDVFLYGDSNSVGLKQFCDDWLRGGGIATGVDAFDGRAGRRRNT